MKRYDFSKVVDEIVQKYDVRVLKWRKNMSGCAWLKFHSNGHATRWIESPRPRTPLSLAIFLHEVGHHVIGFKTFGTGCMDEFCAWQWAQDEMRKIGIENDPDVEWRYEASMRHVVRMAVRRKKEVVPEFLMGFAT